MKIIYVYNGSTGEYIYQSEFSIRLVNTELRLGNAIELTEDKRPISNYVSHSFVTDEDGFCMPKKG